MSSQDTMQDLSTLSIPTDLLSTAAMQIDPPALWCNQCGVSFTEQHQLDIHMMVHANTVPVTTDVTQGSACDLCHAVYANSADLNYHILIEHHDDVKDPSRSTIDTDGIISQDMHTITTPDQILQPQAMNQQPLQAINIQPVGVYVNQGIVGTPQTDTADSAATPKYKYKCDDCGAGFERMLVLKRHQASHTGKKLHACDVCQQEFTSKWNMWRHQKKKHGKVSDGSKPTEMPESPASASQDSMDSSSQGKSNCCIV